MDCWIDIKLNNFSRHWDGQSGQLNQYELAKPLNLINHASELIAGNSPEYNADAIINLNRSIDLRLKQLNYIYKIKNNESLGKFKEWDRLEKLGIIRKKFIAELNKYRNGIEHAYKKAPKKESIENYIDFCWYFIKSTNSLCSSSVETVVFENYESNEELYCHLKYGKKWSVAIRGNVFPEKIIKHENKNFYRISQYKGTEGKILEEQRLQKLEKLKESGQKILLLESQQFNEQHIYWNGKLMLNEGQVYEFYKSIFELT